MQNSFNVDYGNLYVRTSSVLEVLLKELGCNSSSLIGGKAVLFRKSGEPEKTEFAYIVDLKEGALSPGRYDIGNKYIVSTVSQNERLSDKKIKKIVSELLQITPFSDYTLFKQITSGLFNNQT